MLDPLVNPSLGGGAGRALAAASREQTAAMPGGASDTQVADAAPGSPLYFRNWTVWGAGFGSTGSADGSASTGSSQLSASNEGGGAGIDFWAAPNLVVGFAAAGGSMDWSTGSLGTGHGTIAQGGIYAATWFDGAYLTGAFLYGHDDLSTSRSVSADGTLDQLTGSYGADHVAGRAEGGWRFALTPTYGVTPYAAVQVQSFNTGSYTEHDASNLTAFALQYGSQTTTDTRTELGARIDSAPIPIAGIGDGAAALVLRGRAAWAHDFSPDRNLTASFAALPAAGFTVTGAREASDAALLSAGAELRLTPTIALTAKFDTLQAANAHAYAEPPRCV